MDVATDADTSFGAELDATQFAGAIDGTDVDFAASGTVLEVAKFAGATEGTDGDLTASGTEVSLRTIRISALTVWVNAVVVRKTKGKIKLL